MSEPEKVELKGEIKEEKAPIKEKEVIGTYFTSIMLFI